MMDVSSEWELREGCKALSDDEVKWLKKLEKLLRQCPSKRLGFLTTGDQYMTVIDHDIVQAETLDVHDYHAKENGIVLGSVGGLPHFISTSA